MCILPSAQPKAKPGTNPGCSRIQMSMPTGLWNTQEMIWTFSIYSKQQHQCRHLNNWMRNFLRVRFCFSPLLSSLSPSGLRARVFMPEVWWQWVKSNAMTCNWWSEHHILSISFIAYIIDCVVSHGKCDWGAVFELYSRDLQHQNDEKWFYNRLLTGGQRCEFWAEDLDWK